MPNFVDVARFNAVSSGTGDFVVSSAVVGYQTPASAAVTDGRVYSYRAESADLTQWEIGRGVYTASSVTLARTTVTANSSGTTAKINFSIAPQVGLVALASDIQAPNRTLKNRIINGDMRIDQRLEGTSKTITVHPTYTLDRWGAASQAASKFSVQQVVDAPTGSINSLKVTSLSAYTAGAAEEFGIYQQIIGFNVADMAFGTANAATFAISWWVKSSLTGTFSCRVKNNASNRSYVFNYTISAASTWERKEIIIAGDTSGVWPTDKTIGLQLFFDLGGGSNYLAPSGANVWNAGDYNHTAASVAVVGTNAATWQLAKVQLEPGSVTSDFEYRPRELEEKLCYYYYQKSFDPGTVPAQNAGTSIGEFGFVSQAAGVFGTAFAIGKMRSNFTLTTYNPSAAASTWRGLVSAANYTFTGAPVGVGSLLLYGSGSVATDDLRIHWTAETEL